MSRHQEGLKTWVRKENIKKALRPGHESSKSISDQIKRLKNES